MWTTAGGGALLLVSMGVGCLAACAGSRVESRTIAFSPESFESESGPDLDGEIGFLSVPENHDAPGGRTIALAVARLAARGRGSGYPILYLAGGPGAPGIHPERMPLLDALRDYGDVYTFDQRGTGRSVPVLDCPGEVALPPGSAPDNDELIALYRAQARACALYLREQGTEISHYNTRMSARDVDAIRRALGVDKLRLVAASYGSHLALAVIREFGEHVDRAVLALVEGPDHTIKLPADMDAHLRKVSDTIAAHPEAGPLLPDFHAVAVAAIERLERAPVRLQVAGADGLETYVLTAGDMRRLVAGMIGRRFSIEFIVEFFAPIAAGDFSALAGIFPGFRTADEFGMRALMDCTSGLSTERRRLIGEQVETSLLRTAADFPYPDVCEAWGIEDLGDDFRAPVRSSVPALFISGDLDGRTPIGNAEEVMAGFPSSAHIVVEGVGHEGFVFFASPELLPLVGEFMNGSMPASARLAGPELEFSPPPPPGG